MRSLIGTISLLAISASPAWAQDGTANGAPPPAAPPPTAYSSAPPLRAPPSSISGGAPNLRGASVWGILPWGGVGIGARFMVPLGVRPLLVNTNLRDAFALEFGADLLHWSYSYPNAGFDYSWTEVLPVAGVMWNIWVTDRFAFYPKVELGYAFGWYSNLGSSSAIGSYGGVWADGAVGALYNIGGGLTLRAEAGSSGLKLGAGWLF